MKLFSVYGEVEFCLIKVDPVTGKSNGMATIVYKSPLDAADAVRLAPRRIEERTVHIQLSWYDFIIISYEILLTFTNCPVLISCLVSSDCFHSSHRGMMDQSLQSSTPTKSVAASTAVSATTSAAAAVSWCL